MSERHHASNPGSVRGILSGMLALLLAGSAAPSGAEEVLTDGIAAQVGSDVVLVSEVTAITAPMEARIRNAGGTDDDVNKVRADVLERLIERRLIEQLVRRAEVDAPDREVDGAIENIAAENGITLDQLRQSVEAQGLDFQSYREQIRGEIQRTKVLNGIIGANVRISDEELQALYRERFAAVPDSGEELRIRHILVAFEGDKLEDQAAACGHAESALARIRGGEEFAKVASEVSDASPETGGDVGWVERGSLASWMAPVVNALEPGETSEVVRTPFGCNLLHLVDRREVRRLSFEEARAGLYNEAYNRALESEYEAWIDRLRGQTYIERKGLFAGRISALDFEEPAE